MEREGGRQMVVSLSVRPFGCGLPQAGSHTGCHGHCSQPLPLPPCRYIERKAFLERVDHRQFEIERDIRLSRMKP